MKKTKAVEKEVNLSKGFGSPERPKSKKVDKKKKFMDAFRKH